MLVQMKSLNRTTIMLGDDTWIKLLPKTFTRTFEMDSFDVKDLDTVDTSIKRKTKGDIAQSQLMSSTTWAVSS